MSAPATVTQADRDAAIGYWVGWSSNVPEYDGEFHPLVLLLARHRQQAEASFKAREDALVQALQDVVNPLANLQRYAEARGYNLGAQAYSIANNLAFVQGIASEALAARAHTAAEGGE